MCPNCEIKMSQVFGGNFILKGDGWPGKDMNRDKRAAQIEDEKNIAQLQEDQRNQRIVDEVMVERRKGSKASAEYRKNNPQKIKDYEAAVEKGYRPKKAKSYEARSNTIDKIIGEN